MPMAIMAPEFPGAHQRVSSPAFNWSKATLMEESFCFSARRGESCMPTVPQREDTYG